MLSCGMLKQVEPDHQQQDSSTAPSSPIPCSPRIGSIHPPASVRTLIDKHESVGDHSRSIDGSENHRHRSVHDRFDHDQAIVADGSLLESSRGPSSPWSRTAATHLEIRGRSSPPVRRTPLGSFSALHPGSGGRIRSSIFNQYPNRPPRARANSIKKIG